MCKLKLVGPFAVAALLVATAAIATPSPKGPNTWLVNGTYGFDFNGGKDSGPSFATGSGSITFNGSGEVTGGVIYCYFHGSERTSTITGGSYFVRANNTGFVTIDTTGDKVCNQDTGVDLDISVVLSGAKIRFSSDANDISKITGTNIPFAGVAER